MDKGVAWSFAKQSQEPTQSPAEDPAVRKSGLGNRTGGEAKRAGAKGQRTKEAQKEDVSDFKCQPRFRAQHQHECSSQATSTGISRHQDTAWKVGLEKTNNSSSRMEKWTSVQT